MRQNGAPPVPELGPEAPRLTGTDSLGLAHGIRLPGTNQPLRRANIRYPILGRRARPGFFRSAGRHVRSAFHGLRSFLADFARARTSDCATILCIDSGIVQASAAERNGADWTGKGELWVNPRNARMQPALVQPPKKGNIAAPTARASGTERRSTACVATRIVAANLLKLGPRRGFGRR